MEDIVFKVLVASEQHVQYASIICEEMASSAKARGTGIARRSPEYIQQKMLEGKAVIAFHPNGDWAGFCYIETWSHEQYVANSGLIVAPAFRKHGLATLIKKAIFQLSRTKYPQAKIFGLTTGLAVMKINSELGYEPVTYSELTHDEEFWKGCSSCINFEILKSKERKNCLCTAMLYDPAEEKNKQKTKSGINPERHTIKQSLQKIKSYLLASPKNDEDNKTQQSSSSPYTFSHIIQTLKNISHG